MGDGDLFPIQKGESRASQLMVRDLLAGHSILTREMATGEREAFGRAYIECEGWVYESKRYRIRGVSWDKIQHICEVWVSFERFETSVTPNLTC